MSQMPDPISYNDDPDAWCDANLVDIPECNNNGGNLPDGYDPPC